MSIEQMHKTLNSLMRGKHEESRCFCPECGTKLKYNYFEEKLCHVICDRCDSIDALVYGDNPDDACIKVGGNMGFNDVENPKHYQLEGVEPYQAIDFIKAILGRDGFVDFCRGSALKYLVRAGKEDKSKVKDDLEKARVFIRWAIGMLDTFEGEM